jgi:hypothetical protein
LVKIDLDFSGGTPGELVRAIEKASGQPLNAIVPDEFRSLRLPALRMSQVTVPQLFEALEAASQKQIAFSSGSYSSFGGGPAGGTPRHIVERFQSTYGFKTQGPPHGESIWYFYHSTPTTLPEPKVCRFWQLGPYLDQYSIDDITTAIRTGWQMLDETSAPILNFHKDTKLLIGTGTVEHLQAVDSVLAELTPKTRPQSQPTPTDRPARQPRTTESGN